MYLSFTDPMEMAEARNDDPEDPDYGSGMAHMEIFIRSQEHLEMLYASVLEWSEEQKVKLDDGNNKTYRKFLNIC